VRFKDSLVCGKFFEIKVFLKWLALDSKFKFDLWSRLVRARLYFAVLVCLAVPREEIPAFATIPPLFHTDELL